MKKNESTLVRISVDTHEVLRTIAFHERKSCRAIIDEAIENYCKNKKKGAK